MSENTNLIFWDISGPEHAALAQHLHVAASQTRATLSVQTFQDSAAVVAALTTDKSARLCLLYAAPERQLVQAIQAGEDPARVLRIWADAARETLALHRRHRPRSLLFEFTHLCRYSHVGLARLGFEDSHVSLETSQRMGGDDASLLGLIARAYVEISPVVVELRQELDASAQLLSKEARLVPPFSAVLALQNYHALRLQLAEAEYSCAQAWSSDHANRKNLESLHAETAEKKAMLLEQQARLDHLQADSNRQLKEGAARISDLEDLISEQEQAQSDQSANVDALAHKLYESQSRVSTLASEIDQIMNSRSMRVTAPLRRVVSFFGRASSDRRLA